MFAILNTETGKFKPHHASWVMPALYQNEGRAKQELENVKRWSSNYKVVKVKIDIVEEA